MTQEHREFFTNFESPHMPNVGWQEIVAEHKVIEPARLIAILRDAKTFLITAPGPNLERRKILVPNWFNYWFGRIIFDRAPSQYPVGNDFTHSVKLAGYEEVAERLLWHRTKESGLLNLAGAEGHDGHIFAAKYMAERVYTIWAFEQDQYFQTQTKLRGAPFYRFLLGFQCGPIHPI